MSQQTRFFARRLLFIPAALLIVATCAFWLIELLPGDPARILAGTLASDERIEQIRDELGLSAPASERYVDYVRGIGRGDLGTSYFSGRPVSEEITLYLPATIELIAGSLILATLIGVALGTAGAYYQGRAGDRITRWIVTIFQSVPDFFLALILIYLLYFILGLAPAPAGRLGFFDPVPVRVTGFLYADAAIAGDWQTLRVALARGILPTLTLGLVYSAYFAKAARSSVGESLQSQQVTFARACGLRERTVLRYALLDARTPILTFVGILFAALIGAAAIVETVFAWNGLGQWALTAILRNDVPAIRGFVLVSGLVTLLVFLVIDVVVALLDPRVSYA
jgi:ABC-type dipeptide/oligopeptide/nickel transport system permease component